MARYGKVYRTQNWIDGTFTAIKYGELRNYKFIAVDTDSDGTTWYYFQEILN